MGVHPHVRALERKVASREARVGVIGLGYVGLPLAVEFGKQHNTIGFDLFEAKVAAYRNGVDPTGEVHGDQLRAATGLRLGMSGNTIAAPLERHAEVRLFDHDLRDVGFLFQFCQMLI
jgi:hypothetical protein